MDKVHSKWKPPKKRATSKRGQHLQKLKKSKLLRKQHSRTESVPKATANTSGRSQQKFERCRVMPVETAEDEYLIVHSTAFEEMISGLLCGDCKTESLTMKIGDRNGFAFKVIVSCTVCGRIRDISSGPRITTESSSRPPFEINRKMVETFVKIGAGYTAMQTFGMFVGMKTMDQSTYRDHFVKLREENEKLKQEILKLARDAVRKAYRDTDPTITENDIIDVVVSFDGSWHKRGHTSLYGFVSVIEAVTGLVVDYETLSKYCHMCSVAEAELDKDSPEFSFWHDKHVKVKECNSNFEGASGNMEREGAVILWKRSEAAGMRYTKYISDGDAKSLSAINNAQPYGPDILIQKEECVNHVGKRLGTGLRNVVTDYSKKGVTLGGRQDGALTQSKIDKLQQYFTRALLTNAPDVKKMKEAVLATPYHYAATDENPSHKYCPRGVKSWCFYQKQKAQKPRSKPSHKGMKTTLNAKVFKAILPVYERLSANDLIERCKNMLTQNANEALHNVVWSKVPKTNFISKGRLDIGVTQAVGQFNMGVSSMMALTDQLMERPSSAQSMRNAEQIDKKRLAQSDREAEVSTKKMRVAKKNLKKKSKGKTDQYAAGGGD